MDELYEAGKLFHREVYTRIVFTGVNAPTTRPIPNGRSDPLPRPRVRALPASAILVELHAANTGENIRLTRQLLTRRRRRCHVSADRVPPLPAAPRLRHVP